MSFFINDYIIRGGEDLNSPPIIQGLFSPETKAFNVFDIWHSKLGRDDAEVENYIECPVDENNRLFIRAFWDEPPGQRPVCYYIGLLIPQSLYQDVGDYYQVNRGLCSVTLEAAQQAAKKKKPISITIDSDTERSLSNEIAPKLFNDLKNEYKLKYGNEYKTFLTRFLQSVSVNSISDWFQQLFVAVNPYQLEPEYEVVFSRRRPLPGITRKQSLVQGHDESKRIVVLDGPLSGAGIWGILLTGGVVCLAILAAVVVWFCNKFECIKSRNGGANVESEQKTTHLDKTRKAERAQKPKSEKERIKPNDTGEASIEQDCSENAPKHETGSLPDSTETIEHTNPTD